MYTKHTFSARIFAVFTILSMLASAFPAAFFVAHAANTDAVGTIDVSVIASNSSGPETVEVSFTGTGTLDLTGWSIWDTETSERNVFTFGSVMLLSGESFTVCHDGSCDGTSSGGATVWNDTGDRVQLRDETGVEVAFVAYDSASPDQEFSQGSEINYAPDVEEKTEIEIDVFGNTSTFYDEPGTWLFNRDTNTATEFEFNTDESTTGDGAIYVEPIDGSLNGNSDKFIGELFVHQLIDDIVTISYDYRLGDTVPAGKANEFYGNAYVNFDDSDDFGHCVYNIVPSDGSAGWHTATFDPTQSYDVRTRSSAPSPCPSIPADLPDTAELRMFAINLGDTSNSDQDVDGYFDTVVVENQTSITTYDLEPVPPLTKLGFTSICRIDDGGLRFRVENKNDVAVTATYEVVGTSDTGTVEVAASGEGVIKFEGQTAKDFTFFDTVEQTGPGTTKLSYDDGTGNIVVLTKAANNESCPEPDTGELRICKMIVNRDGNLVNGAALSGDFSIEVTGPNNFDKTYTFSPILDLNTDLVDDNGSDNDAECIVEEVPAGQYLYAMETIASDYSWETPLYHDFFTKTPDSLSDFAAYTIDGSDNDNDDTDGVINLGKNKSRTLAIVNTQTPVCGIGENLLTNGSFEEPVVTNNKLWQKFASVAGWMIEKVSDQTPTTLEVHRGWSGNTAADGWQYTELDGDHSTQISQTITTVPGATYELKWAFAPRHNISADQNQLSVLLNDSVVAANGPATGAAGLTAGDWTQNTYSFKATSEQTTVTFADAGPSNSFGTYLDDAAVCFVSEPEEVEPEVCSYEGSVVSVSEPALKNNGNPVDANRRNIAAVEAGVAPYSNFFGKEGNDWQVSPLDFFSLGINGELVYEFTDKVAIDGPGDDIAIWEITGGNPDEITGEKADVYGSEEGINFVLLGQAQGDQAFDIAGSGLDFVKFVKLVDQSNGVQGGNGDGFDLDAITIVDESCSDYANLHATKVVCTDESELPNWGAGIGREHISATTAMEWVANHKSCSIDETWEFEWALADTPDPGDSIFGSAGADWNTFAQSTMIPLTALGDDNYFWVRELFKPDYLAFSHESAQDNSEDVSAEMYCHVDVRKYDNRETVDYPKAGEDYYCVAWNVPEAPSCELTILSDTGTLVTETNQYAVETYEHNAWTAVIDSATWIWGDAEVVDPENDTTYTFKETFTADGVSTALLDVAADNGYQVKVNGVIVPELDRLNLENNFQTHTTKNDVDITSYLIAGENEITFEVMNLGVNNSNYRSNPAGLLFRLDIEATENCAVTTEPEIIPEEDEYLITGKKYQVDNQEESETLYPGWTIFATQGTTTLSTTTDQNGEYFFLVGEGDWTISEATSTNWTLERVERNGEIIEGETCDFSFGDQEFLFTQISDLFIQSLSTCDFYNSFEEPETPPENPNDDDDNGGSSSSGTRTSSPSVAPLVLGATTSQCPFLNDYMQMGIDNDPMEVMKLQLFLNIFRSVFGGTENPVSGTFGAITDANVKAFQEFYRSEVLDPWFEQGIVPHNRPTGFVYKTTLWKINDIVCGAEFPSLEGENLQSNVDLNVRGDERF